MSPLPWPPQRPHGSPPSRSRPSDPQRVWPQTEAVPPKDPWCWSGERCRCQFCDAWMLCPCSPTLLPRWTDESLTDGSRQGSITAGSMTSTARRPAERNPHGSASAILQDTPLVCKAPHDPQSAAGGSQQGTRTADRGAGRGMVGPPPSVTSTSTTPALTVQFTRIVPSGSGLAWRTALPTSSEITISASPTTIASTSRSRNEATNARRASRPELNFHGTRRVCADILIPPARHAVRVPLFTSGVRVPAPLLRLVLAKDIATDKSRTF